MHHAPALLYVLGGTVPVRNSAAQPRPRRIHGRMHIPELGDTDFRWTRYKKSYEFVCKHK